MQESTSVKSYDVVNASCSQLNFSLANAFFGAECEHLSVRATNVSFGVTKDKFYANTHYVQWTFSAGFGSPPEDDLSTMIIVIIAVGLGVPFVLVVVGAVCAFVQGRKAKTTAATSMYQPIA